MHVEKSMNNVFILRICKEVHFYLFISFGSPFKTLSWFLIIPIFSFLKIFMEMETHSKQPIPGEFHGQSNLVGYRLWGCKESDMTEHD